MVKVIGVCTVYAVCVCICVSVGGVCVCVSSVLSCLCIGNDQATFCLKCHSIYIYIYIYMIYQQAYIYLYFYMSFNNTTVIFILQLCHGTIHSGDCPGICNALHDCNACTVLGQGVPHIVDTKWWTNEECTWCVKEQQCQKRNGMLFIQQLMS